MSESAALLKRAVKASSAADALEKLVLAWQVRPTQVLVASEANGQVTLALSSVTGEARGQVSYAGSLPSRSGRLVAATHDTSCIVLDVSTMTMKTFAMKKVNAVGFTRDEKHVLLAAQKLERRPL
jgi:hypothetical protein